MQIETNGAVTPEDADSDQRDAEGHHHKVALVSLNPDKTLYPDLDPFWGLLAGMAVVLTVAFQMPWIEFLWHNLIGAVVVTVVGLAISAASPNTTVP